MKLTYYYNTLKYLKTIQIYYRLYYFLQKKRKKQLYKTNKHIQSYPLSLKESIPSYTSYKGNNCFEFLNKEHHFHNEIEWNYAKFGKLWTYNLNYFEFLNQNEISKDEGLALIYNYCNSITTIKDGLEAAPISIRALNWIKFLSKHKIYDKTIDTTLFMQYELLFKNIEYHLLGNHLLENGFSLLFGAYYFHNEKFYKKAKTILQKELQEQILEDGAHFELSPMYHQLMLFRLLDCINLLSNNSYKKDESFLKFLQEKAALMLGYLEQITFNNGEIPLVNDSALKVAPTTKELFEYAKRVQIKPILKELSSGYHMIKNNRYELFIDAANLEASYIPGHTHSDLFNFLLYIDKKEFIVDTGVSTYESNNIRSYERSVKAHNCITIEDENDTEVWSSFRVAKRAKVTKKKLSSKTLFVEHNGYVEKYNTYIQREFHYDNSSITILNKLLGEQKEAKLYLHFANNVQVTLHKNFIMTDFGVSIYFSSYNSLKLQDSYYAKEFNKKIASKVLEISFTKELEMEIKI